MTMKPTQFVQTGYSNSSNIEVVPGTCGKVYCGKTCWTCHKQCHISPVHPNAASNSIHTHIQLFLSTHQ